MILSLPLSADKDDSALKDVLTCVLLWLSLQAARAQVSDLLTGYAAAGNGMYVLLCTGNLSLCNRQIGLVLDLLQEVEAAGEEAEEPAQHE